MGIRLGPLVTSLDFPIRNPKFAIHNSPDIRPPETNVDLLRPDTWPRDLISGGLYHKGWTDGTDQFGIDRGSVLGESLHQGQVGQVVDDARIAL